MLSLMESLFHIKSKNRSVLQLINQQWQTQLLLSGTPQSQHIFTNWPVITFLEHYPTLFQRKKEFIMCETKYIGLVSGRQQYLALSFKMVDVTLKKKTKTSVIFFQSKSSNTGYFKCSLGYAYLSQPLSNMATITMASLHPLFPLMCSDDELASKSYQNSTSHQQSTSVVLKLKMNYCTITWKACSIIARGALPKEFLIQQVQRGIKESAFLTSSQVMLMLLVHVLCLGTILLFHSLFLFNYFIRSPVSFLLLFQTN